MSKQRASPPRPYKEVQRIARECLEVENLLVMGRGSAYIVNQLSEKWDCCRMTVTNRIVMVRDAWREESRGVDRQGKRDEHRARLATLFRSALEAESPMTDPEGKPCFDNSGNVIMVKQPDRRTAKGVLDSMAKLDALNEELVHGPANQDLITIMQMAGLVEQKQKELGKAN